MNDFIEQLVTDIMDTIEEDRGYAENLLRADIKHIIKYSLDKHDKEIMEQAKDMLDQDAVYDEGYDDGYTSGWNDAREEIQELARDMQEPRRS